MAKKPPSPAQQNTGPTPATQDKHLLRATPLTSQIPAVPLLCFFIPLLLVRLTGAIYSTISDCDETYNYWEAVHLVLFGNNDPAPGQTVPMKTWEYDPKFAIRSWAYILVHAVPGAVGRLVLRIDDKLVIFYLTRCTLALVSSWTETRLIATVTRIVNARCGWFLFLMLLCTAGMWSASVALLPSTFTLYTTTLAMSYALQPACSVRFPASQALTAASPRRTLKATCAFALGALLGWPFALVLAVPFVFEELFLTSGNVLSRSGQRLQLVLARLRVFVRASLVAAAAIALPTFLVDTLFYGKPTMVPLNIIVYNILSSRRGAGPELYGVEPPWFYLANLALNVGPVVLALALGVLPILLLLKLIDRGRFASAKEPLKGHQGDDGGGGGGSGPTKFTLLIIRTMPFYLWLGLLSTQPHKEERFMFPAYTALCLNAALSLECITGLLEKAIFTLIRRRRGTPGGVTQVAATLPVLASLSVLVLSGAFSLLRILGILHAYHAPMTTLSHLNDRSTVARETFLSPTSTAAAPMYLNDLFHIDTPEEVAAKEAARVQRDSTRLNICYGKEWYRFPGSLWLPRGFQLQFIKSEFQGILPRQFPQDNGSMSLLDTTRRSESGFNDLNREEPDRYVRDPETQCHFLIDSDPAQDLTTQSAAAAAAALQGKRLPPPPRHEPYYSLDAHSWDILTCQPFMDAAASRGYGLRGVVARVLWVPDREQYTTWKRFCLLANRRLMRGDNGGGGADADSRGHT